MGASRRQFLKTSALSASLPLMTSLDMASAASGAGKVPDLSLGYRPGAVRMNLNENPLGPPAAAVRAAQSAIPSTNRYVTPALLKQLLADFVGLEKDWMIVGNGSTEILKAAPLAFTRGTGHNLVSARETWSTTPKYAAVLGADIRYVPMLKGGHWSFDIDTMLRRVDSNTGIFFIVNPNNPTGALLEYEQLKEIADNLPAQTLFIIDEAYAQYTPGIKTGMDLLREGYGNILVTRTFSKAYGLAALRCGFGAGHPDLLKKIGRHGCDAASLNIGAYSALQVAMGEEAFLQRSRELAKEVTAYYKTESNKLGLKLVTGPVALPFVLMELGPRAGAIQKELEKQNIFVRHVASWGMPEHIRISCGLRAHNEAFSCGLRAHNEAFFGTLKTLL